MEYQTQYAFPEQPRRRYDGVTSTPTHHVFVEFDGTQHFDPDHYYNSSDRSFETSRQRDIEKAQLVINKYKYRMIRLTYNTLKCDRDQIKALYAQAINTRAPLLYIDAVGSVPFLSPKADKYEWLTSQIGDKAVLT